METENLFPQDFINLFYPIKADTVVFNANDAVGKQSPLLIRLDNNYQENMAVELDEAVRNNPKLSFLLRNILMISSLTVI